MRRTLRKFPLLPLLFTLGGGLTGLAYYLTVICPGGRCASFGAAFGITMIAAYFGWLAARLLSSVRKKCGCPIRPAPKTDAN